MTTWNPKTRDPNFAKLARYGMGIDKGEAIELVLGEDDYGCDLKVYGATSGAYLFWDESADTLYVTGTLDLNGGNFAFGDGDLLKFGDGSDITMNWDGSKFEVEGAAASSTYNVGTLAKNLNVVQHGTLTVGVDDKGYDVKLFGATTSKYWLWDESDNKMIVIGDFDITGDSQFTGAITVGVDDTGYDVTFYGATSGSYLLWDESEDKLILAAADLDVTGGDIIAGADGATRGTLKLWDGASGNTPGYVAFGSPNGSIWYLFVEDDGTVKIHEEIPTQNSDGSEVGGQS